MEVLLSLYGIEVIKIMKEFGMHTSIIETNWYYIMDELGLKQKCKQRIKSHQSVMHIHLSLAI